MENSLHRKDMRPRFRLWHSVLGMTVFVIVQAALMWLLSRMGLGNLNSWIILIAALVGGTACIIVATEVIEEVRNAKHMLVILSAVVFEFVIFFAFEYWFLELNIPGSFAALHNDAVSMLLHSTMTFVFNPLYQPANGIARAVLLINTLESLALVLFILQNVWQFRSKE